jgi:hypothetical protein
MQAMGSVEGKGLLFPRRRVELEGCLSGRILETCLLKLFRGELLAMGEVVVPEPSDSAFP